MAFLDDLNTSQRQAVTAPLVPILVLAGPGTGKTRTLISRILYLIHAHQIAPHKILAVTFTNKAKEEMQHRLRQALGDRASDLKIGTFHRFCMTILREHADIAGLPPQFAIADETTQLIALSRVSRIQDEKSLRTVLNAISTYRLNKASLNPTFQDIALKWLQPYHEELRRNKLIDFDHILLVTHDLFARHPELTPVYQQAFDAILVDEFQDTDPIQYELMNMLAQHHHNIFVVADDDQSIFAWRGANIENIDRYIRDFDCREAQIVILNENYRSAQYIIDVATKLINCGPRFREKRIMATTPDTDDVPVEQHFRSFADDMAEIEFILDQIGSLSPNIPYSDIAVLYPTHAIGEQLESKLLAARIPCQLVKRQGVFDQEDVRKIVLLLKLLQNPWDDVALEQFFQLELSTDLVFEQIRALKAKNQSFRQTLHQLNAQPEEIAGMSKSELGRRITNTFGLISNLISYVDQHPDIELADLINHICNLTKPTHIATIHGQVEHLCDPLEIPGMPEAVEKIRAAVSAGQTIRVCGSTPAVTGICCYLLNCWKWRFDDDQSSSYFQSAPTDAKALLVPRSASNATRSVEDERSTQSVEREACLLCLDDQSADNLRMSHPDISEAQLILLCSPFSTVVTAFKVLQALTATGASQTFKNYTVVDLETTSNDTQTAGIVEIGATKVQEGQVVGAFDSLVNPKQPITQKAYEVHHISEDEIKHERTFADLLPEFMEFIGNDLLVAHNGFNFDFPILMRLYKDATGKVFPNRRFDTLPLARQLFPGQPASVDALMQRFAIRNIGGRHRALDDTKYLAVIFERLQAVEQSLNRRSEHEELLELVALGIYLEKISPEHQCPGSKLKQAEACSQDALAPFSFEPAGPEQSRRGALAPGLETEEYLLFQLGAKKLLSRFSELPEQFRALYEQHQIDIEHLLETCTTDRTASVPLADGQRDAGGTSRITDVFSGKDAAIARIKELTAAFPADNIREAIQQFLDHATLYTSQDDIREVNAVNLLTIHSAKGLEFPVVFVSGVEKGSLPSFYSVREEGELGQKKLDEQRRLFYVALTRTKQKLFVTYVDKRGEYDRKRSQFLVELGVASDDMDSDETLT